MQIMSTCHEDQYTVMIMSHSLFLKMKNVVDKIVEKIKTHILCSINFILKKSCHLWVNVEKYCRAEHATDDNSAHVFYMLVT
jgi:hypothetical protein